jgi:hypothetical protein
MEDGEDFLMRPVMEGMCKYESWLDGTLDLADAARMNEAISIRNHNQFLIEEAYRNKKDRR